VFHDLGIGRLLSSITGQCRKKRRKYEHAIPVFEEQFSFKVLGETAGNIEVVVMAKWFGRVLAKVGLPFYVIILVLIICLLK
jgi:hypothetical protein